MGNVDLGICRQLDLLSGRWVGSGCGLRSYPAHIPTVVAQFVLRTLPSASDFERWGDLANNFSDQYADQLEQMHMLWVVDR